MNLVFIYGPPGVGKLTVAKELVALTGYKLFHNHLSIDCVLPVFDYSATFWNVVNDIRLLVIEEAARSGVDLIITEAYCRSKDDAGVYRTCEVIERWGGHVCPVHLICDKQALEQRVQGQDRVESSKTSSGEELRREMEKYDYFTPIPGRESLSIDNTDLAPDEVARRIVAHYGLRTLRDESRS